MSAPPTPPPDPPTPPADEIRAEETETEGGKTPAVPKCKETADQETQSEPPSSSITHMALGNNRASYSSNEMMVIEWGRECRILNVS